MYAKVCVFVYLYVKVDSQNGFLEVEACLVRKRKILTAKELNKYLLVEN